jgi:hypothetical protein
MSRLDETMALCRRCIMEDIRKFWDENNEHLDAKNIISAFSMRAYPYYRLRCALNDEESIGNQGCPYALEHAMIRDSYDDS